MNSDGADERRLTTTFESPTVGPMKTITITLTDGELPALERLLIKLKASELSELRSAQTQLSVYGDRRATLTSVPGTAQGNIDLLEGVIGQLREQR